MQRFRGVGQRTGESEAVAADPRHRGWAEATTALAERTELRERGNQSRQEEEEEDDKWGPHVSDRREKLQQSIHIRIHLQLGPT
jgi:hypothetical protein